MEMDFHVRMLDEPPRRNQLSGPSIEGALTIGIAILGYWIVLPFPDALLASSKKGYFTHNELEIVLDRVERDRGDSRKLLKYLVLMSITHQFRYIRFLY